MNVDHLVKMANQIAGFFEPWADRDDARDEVANHLRRFWSPRMRKALSDHVEAGMPQHGVSPLVVQAITELGRDPLRVRPQPAPASTGRDLGSVPPAGPAAAPEA